MRRRRRWLLAFLAVLAVLVTGCGGGDGATSEQPAALETVSPDEAATMTIAQVLRSDERFSRFRGIAERVETPIADSFFAVWDWNASRMGDQQEGVTVFAPTDAAFDALDPAVLAVLDDPQVDNTLLYALIGHHYVHRLYPSEEFEPGPQATWRRSPSGPVEMGTGPPTWGGHPVTQVDLRAANGYIHVVDGVVVPDALLEAAADHLN